MFKRLGTFGIFLAHESRHSPSSDLHGWAAMELGLNLMLSKIDDAKLNDIRHIKIAF